VQQLQQHTQQLLRALCAGLAAAALLLSPVNQPAAQAARGAPPIKESADRCAVTALDSFADVSLFGVRSEFVPSFF
jgi:hypothetical protein